MKQIFAHKHINELTDGELDLVCAMLQLNINVVAYYSDGFAQPRVYVRPVESPENQTPTLYSPLQNKVQFYELLLSSNVTSMKLNNKTNRWKARSEHVKTYDTRLEKAIVLNVIIQHLSNLSADISVFVDDDNNYIFGVVE